MNNLKIIILIILLIPLALGIGYTIRYFTPTIPTVTVGSSIEINFPHDKGIFNECVFGGDITIAEGANVEFNNCLGPNGEWLEGVITGYWILKKG